MVRFEEGTKKGDDIEALHDMRVWSRRLREALEVFAFCFPEKIYDKLYRRVKQVTKALGNARNADVAVEFFSKHLAESQDMTERFAFEDLLNRLAKDQTREREKMVNKLNKKVRAANLPSQLEQAFRDTAAQRGFRRRGPRTALRLARTLISQRLNNVFAVRRAITGENDVEQLHKLRIAVKKLRYALEALEFAAGENAAENLKFFKKLQTVLGDLHDRDVFIATVQGRFGSLQAQPYTTQLLTGYERVLERLAEERHSFYQEYVSHFGNAKLTEMRRHVVPPAKPATPAVEVFAPETSAPPGKVLPTSKATSGRRQTRKSSSPTELEIPQN